MVSWEIHAKEFGNCNCGYSCPCQFNELPTHGSCEAVGFFRIDNGHFGDTQLDGLKMAMVVQWPGPVHEGKGVMQPVLDADADETQKNALLSIMTGKETDEMATVFAVYAAMCDTVHDPISTEIKFEYNADARGANCEAIGVAKGRGEPIRNSVTGDEHRVGIHLPDGFEFTLNEVGRGWSTSQGHVALNLEDSYAHWADINMNQHGVIR
jgi:hypothetical protein